MHSGTRSPLDCFGLGNLSSRSLTCSATGHSTRSPSMRRWTTLACSRVQSTGRRWRHDPAAHVHQSGLHPNSKASPTRSGVSFAPGNTDPIPGVARPLDSPGIGQRRQRRVARVRHGACAETLPARPSRRHTGASGNRASSPQRRSEASWQLRAGCRRWTACDRRRPRRCSVCCTPPGSEPIPLRRCAGDRPDHARKRSGSLDRLAAAGASTQPGRFRRSLSELAWRAESRLEADRLRARGVAGPPRRAEAGRGTILAVPRIFQALPGRFPKLSEPGRSFPQPLRRQPTPCRW